MSHKHAVFRALINMACLTGLLQFLGFVHLGESAHFPRFRLQHLFGEIQIGDVDFETAHLLRIDQFRELLERVQSMKRCLVELFFRLRLRLGMGMNQKIRNIT